MATDPLWERRPDTVCLNRLGLLGEVLGSGKIWVSHLGALVG